MDEIKVEVIQVIDGDSEWENSSDAISVIPEKLLPCDGVVTESVVKDTYTAEMEDDELSINIENFWSKHKCSNDCLNSFTKEEVMNMRLESQALDHNVGGSNLLHFVVLATIRVMKRKQYTKTNRKRYPNKEQEKGRCMFMVRGISVCKAFFLYTHNLTNKRWKTLLKTYKNEGLVQKLHGLCKRSPTNWTPLDKTQFIVQFLQDYAKDHNSFLVGRAPNCGVTKKGMQSLSSWETKKDIYVKYCNAYDSHSVSEPVSLSVFRKIWRQCCPEISLLKPRTDSFNQSQQNSFTTKNCMRIIQYNKTANQNFFK